MFTPVGLLIETPQIMSVHPDVPVKTLPELVAYAKANPGKITWGSQGFGTSPHLLAEMFKLETGVNIVHVPYRGTAPMLAAILAGEVQMVADASTTSLPHIQAGKLRADRGADRRALLEICRTCRPRRGGLSEAAARRSGSAWWRRPARRPTIVDKLNAAFRESIDAAGDARSGSPTSAPRSRSARRPSSARCSPRSWRSGPPWPRPPTSGWSD